MNLSRFYGVPKLHPNNWEIRFFENDNGRGVVWPNKLRRWPRVIFTILAICLAIPMYFPWRFVYNVVLRYRENPNQFIRPDIEINIAIWVTLLMLLAAVFAWVYLFFLRKIHKFKPRALFLDRQGVIHTPYGANGERKLRRTRFHIDDITSVEYGGWSEWNHENKPGFEVFVMMSDGYRLRLSDRYNRDGASQITTAIRKLVE
jgi:hypothetical protein